jgi:hypothetical protein
MEYNLTTILLALGILLAGWLIGFFDSRLRASRKMKKAQVKQKDENEEAPAAADWKGELKQVNGQEGVNLLRLWTDPAKNMKLDLDGQPVDTANLTSRQSRQLVAYLTRMRPWLESKTRAAEEQKIAAPPVQVIPAAVEAALPTQASALSIVSQINDILQLIISGTPVAQRGVRVQESISGGVEVWIGTSKYEGVDAVPDEEVKKLLKQAVSEWEESQP